MINLINVAKTYDHSKSYVVNHISLEVHQNEFLVILGSSGSGKTTTLKMINRLIELSSGTIEINGQNIQEQNPVLLRRSIGYAFQGVGLFPHMTVEENIVIVLRLLKVPYKARIKRAHELLRQINLNPDEYANRTISELSGGQLQRIGVARALANNPQILLMDEPFGALDAITRSSLQDELLRLNAELKKTIVFVTHDIFEAFKLADRIVVMHEGDIHQIGTREEILNHPETEFVQQLVRDPMLQISRLMKLLIKR